MNAAQSMDTPSFPTLRFNDGSRRGGGTTKSEGTLARLSVDFQRSLNKFRIDWKSLKCAQLVS